LATLYPPNFLIIHNCTPKWIINKVNVQHNLVWNIKQYNAKWKVKTIPNSKNNDTMWKTLYQVTMATLHIIFAYNALNMNALWEPVLSNPNAPHVSPNIGAWWKDTVPNFIEESHIVLREGISTNTDEDTLINADPCEIETFRPTSLVSVASNILSSLCQVSIFDDLQAEYTK